MKKSILLLGGLLFIAGCYPPPQPQPQVIEKPVIVEREKPVYIPQQAPPKRDVSIGIGVPIVPYGPRYYDPRPYYHGPRYYGPRPYYHGPRPYPNHPRPYPNHR